MKMNEKWRRALMASEVVSMEDLSFTDKFDSFVEKETPESLLMKKEAKSSIEQAFSSMSDEAKQIFNMIINSPTEIIDLLRCRNINGISLKKIERFLTKEWEDARYAKRVTGELKKFIGEA
ncbi:MAG: hypothetical protein PHO27_12975 [Sulfuricurvum sp.]|jgi:hypothetical protein|nr:hypothetical protein [Sulfuricurvum sp.]